MPNNWEELQETGKTIVREPKPRTKVPTSNWEELQQTGKTVVKKGGAEDLQKKIANFRALRQLAKRAGKYVPVLGGITTALATGEAHAAIPGLSEASEMGQPEEGTVGALVQNPDRPEEITDIISNPETSDKEKEEAIDRYLKIKNKLNQ